ncbi:tight adherence protein B [Paramicrobacterium humi]|uniref:Tight adherence protein B n=1 Tax=Paramicrobacterium humi TaxID=640635 RepID=A0A1H4NJ22_9MICO|nr:type II secretion system F family protein [Microbacterium humi]SEB95227.1 tight adherence protein B [Microbacterium humi]
MRRRDPTPAVEHAAGVAERLAVLLAGGVAPSMAWRYLDESLGRRDPVKPAVSAAAAAAAAGKDVPAALAAADGAAADAWRCLAAALEVATACGAPVAGALRTLAETLRSLGQTQRDIATVLAAPRSTARLVMALPLVGIGFGLLLGFDTAGALLSPFGAAAAIAGILLMLAGWRWSSRLARRATPRDSAPGLLVDLTAIAMSGGASADSALETAAASAASFDLPGTDDDAAREVIQLAQRAGVPASELLRSEAQRIRRDASSQAARAAARLGTSLMIPLGVCVLPAFMLLGVVPMMLGVLSTTKLGF